jgi:hypothetical protein
MSYASDLVPNDTNRYHDVFMRDMVGGTTVRVSVSSSGGQANKWSQSTAISADGRYVGFRSKATNLVVGDTNGRNDVFLRDMEAGITTRASVSVDGGNANWNCFNPSVSSEAGVVQVAFVTKASNIVADDDNRLQDIFLREYS